MADDAPAPSKEMMESLNRLANMVNASDDPATADALRDVAARLSGPGSTGSRSRGSGGSRGRRGRSRTRRGSRGSSASRRSGSRSASGSSASRSRSGSRSASVSTGSSSSRSRSGSRGSSYSSRGSRSRSRSADSRSSGGSRSRSRSRSSGSYSSGTGRGSQSTWRPGAAVAVRRPTPYELWSSSHIVAKAKPKVRAPQPRPFSRCVVPWLIQPPAHPRLLSWLVPTQGPKKVTRAQWNDIVQRLTDTTRQRHARHLQEQSQAVAEEVRRASAPIVVLERCRHRLTTAHRLPPPPYDCRWRP